MDRKLTVDVKSILIAGLVLLGLVVAYLIGSVDDGPGTRAVAADEVDRPDRTVLMTGTGKASVVPDQLSFSVSVTSPDQTSRTRWRSRTRPWRRCWPRSRTMA